MAVAVVVVMGVVWAVVASGSGLGLQWVECFFFFLGEERYTYKKREEARERKR